MTDIVGALVEKLEQFERYRKPLRMRRKDVEAMALDIRQRLQAKMEACMEGYNGEIPFRERQQLFDWKHENETPHLRAADYEAFLETHLHSVFCFSDAFCFSAYVRCFRRAHASGGPRAAARKTLLLFPTTRCNSKSPTITSASTC